MRSPPVFLLLTAYCLLLTAGSAQAAHVEPHDAFPVVYLEGTPYELGRQHGELLRDRVRASVGHLLGYFRHYLKIPLLGAWAVNWWLDHPWKHALPSIPKDYLDELQGLADGSGVPLKELARLHAIPDRTYACSSLAVWGQATSDGRLIHTRNLDWNIHAGIQEYAVVFVVHPRGKQAFVNVGWAGFIGVLTGINDEQLSIGQIGAETVDVSSRGLPMVFVMRRVLEEAESLETAVRIVQEAPRTVGINYVVADADAKRAVALETTHRLIAVFEADDANEHAVSYARPMRDVVFRADTAMDPRIRDRQIASEGDPKSPGLESPAGSAYEVRYLGQAQGIAAQYGRIDADGAIEIAKAVAPSSNVQSVVFAWPEIWIANAQGNTRAAHTTYHRLDLDQLLKKAPE